MSELPDSEDVFEAAVAELAIFGDGIVARNQEPWLTLPNPAVDPRAPGFLALRLIDKCGPVGVRIGSIMARTVMMWVEPELAVVQPTQNVSRRSAVIYRLPSGFGPSSYTSAEEFPNGSSIILEDTPGWARIEELFEAVDTSRDT